MLLCKSLMMGLSFFSHQIAKAFARFLGNMLASLLNAVL